MVDFAEMNRVRDLAKISTNLIRSSILNEVTDEKGRTYPIYSFVIGADNPELPTFGMFGGVHGLERIGTHVTLHFIESLVRQMSWDSELRQRFERCRLVSIPMINPWGIHNHSRANANGVDLMRNAPVEAQTKPPFLVGGQRYSNKLPWYRGDEGKPMQVESQTLIDFVKKEMFPSQYSLSLDVHSGFGTRDRLWYPYAKTTAPFPLLQEALKFKTLFENSFPNHIYLIEPQAISYTTHGDLWDYLFDMHYDEFHGNKIYIPWCLEMGSWLWVKKNPRQLFSLMGFFNPILPHRYKRIMRRHYQLLDFFLRSIASYKNWV
jgi:hypothetical protein